MNTFAYLTHQMDNSNCFVTLEQEMLAGVLSTLIIGMSNSVPLSKLK